MKKIIVATDSFKGTLSALQATQIIAEEFKNTGAFEVLQIPLADGGEGTLDLVKKYCKAKSVIHECKDLTGNSIQAEYLLLNGQTAFIESAQTIGFNLACGAKIVQNYTTFGLGEQISHARNNGVKKIYVSLGGSGTNDFGCGMAVALGAKFYDKNGKQFIPVGKSMSQIFDLDFSNVQNLFKDVMVVALCDVNNPPYGENGAAYIYAPQKGADAKTCEVLDWGVRHICELLYTKYNIDLSSLSGGGAAGALGAGLVAFCNAQIKSGINFALNVSNFREHLNDCDLVITGEGCTDNQSASGKVISGVCKLAKECSVPVVVISGKVMGSLRGLYNLGTKEIFASTDSLHEVNKEEAEENLRKKAKEVAIKYSKI